MLRALNVHFRLGGTENATALANYAARADAPDALRKEALALLTLWPSPPARDRVVGVFRPLAEKSRPANVAVDAVTSHLHELFATTTPVTVQAAALDLVVKLKIAAAMPMLRAAVAARNGEPEAVRTAALKDARWVCRSATGRFRPGRNGLEIPPRAAAGGPARSARACIPKPPWPSSAICWSTVPNRNNAPPMLHSAN